MRVTRTIAIAALASLSLLSGCGIFGDEESSSDAVQVYPSVGTLEGVVSAQIAVVDNSADQSILQYNCAEGYDSVPFGYRGSEFNGVNITTDIVITSDNVASKDELIMLSGDTSDFKPVSLIVSVKTDYRDSDPDATTPSSTYYSDDQVVSITPEMIEAGQLRLGGRDFGFSAFYPDPDSESTMSAFSGIDFRFCVPQA